MRVWEMYRHLGGSEKANSHILDMCNKTTSLNFWNLLFIEDWP